MRVYFFFFVTIIHVSVLHADGVQATATQHAKVPLVISVVEGSAQLTEVATMMQHDFSFSGQFDVSINKGKKKPTKKDIKKLFAEGFSLAVFLSEGKKNSIEWRVYDTLQGKMVKGKRYAKRGIVCGGWAHNIADVVWPILTNQHGFFSTKIAYCKEVKLKNGKSAKQVCMADYDGTNEQILVDLPTVNVAPRWNKDMDNPLLFYSEYTNENVRLVAVNMERKRKITSNFDGINMLPAFSRDGKKVVYCASRGDGHCQLYYCDKSGFKKVTNNKGNNVSPSLSDDGSTIFFCSDYQTGRPQVYVYRLKTGNIECITNGGYCASPSYCEKRKQIAYAKIVQGTMQLFVYDERSKKHTQLTFDAGSKEECSWSPCGNYLTYSVEQGKTQRIAVLNLLTKQQRYITTANINCSYPAWSPIYAQFPVVA